MKIVSERIRLRTKGSGDLVDITGDLRELLEATGLRTGSVLFSSSARPPA